MYLKDVTRSVHYRRHTAVLSQGSSVLETLYSGGAFLEREYIYNYIYIIVYLYFGVPLNGEDRELW